MDRIDAHSLLQTLSPKPSIVNPEIKPWHRIVQALVATVDSIDAHSLLQSMASMSYDGSRLIDMACIAFAGVTGDQIAGLRKAYTTTVAAEKRDVRASTCLWDFEPFCIFEAYHPFLCGLLWGR